MKTPKKFAYIALGGLLMLIGMMASSIFMPNLVAQRDKFGEIECTGLTVVDSNGDERIHLKAGTYGGVITLKDSSTGKERITLWSSDLTGFVSVDYGSSRAKLAAYSDGTGQVETEGKDGASELAGGRVTVYGEGESMLDRGRVVLKTNKDGGGVIVVRGKDEIEGKFGFVNPDNPSEGLINEQGKNERGSIILGTDENGGWVFASGDGKAGVRLGMDEHGGQVFAVGKDEKSIVSLGFGEHGGYVSAAGKDQQSKAVIAIEKYGGGVAVQGKGKGAALIAINEYGNGAVSTWDKNGYRQ